MSWPGACISSRERPHPAPLRTERGSGDKAMDLGEFVEQALNGAFVAVAAPTEADYHSAWLLHQIGNEDPFVMAAMGGALADRMAWVYEAGYQGTLRRCFPDLPAEPGWSAFVNREDPAGDLPGTSLTGAPGNR